MQRLVPMLGRILAPNGTLPEELSADAGYSPESNFIALADAHVNALIALRRYHHDEPSDADHSAHRLPQSEAMREKLTTTDGKARYKLRKQTVEPVIGQVKSGRGLRQLLCRGLAAVEAEWSLACTAHNLLKLHRALQLA